MKRILRGLLALSVGFALIAGASASAEDFYKGKTIRWIVGASPGGGYDTYTRLIARYIGKHIPGNPDTLVQNMPGAGMLIAANYIYKRAKPDGLTIGLFNNALIMSKGLGDPLIKIDFRKMGWVGAPTVGELVCMIMGFTGLKTLDLAFEVRDFVRQDLDDQLLKSFEALPEVRELLAQASNSGRPSGAAR